MLSKTVNSISRSTSEMITVSVDLVRGLTLREVRDLFRFARRRLREERLPQVAGSLTFTTVLALVPLLTIALAIFTTFPVFSSFRAALEAYFVQALIPKQIANTIASNLTVFANKATRLSAVGGVALLVTCAAMMGMIERVFNQIWRVRQPRPLAQRVLVYWALATLGPLLGAMFYTAVSVALTTGAFTLLYMAIPNRYVEWRDAMWGGLVAALAFEIGKRLFAIFIQQFPTYAIIYGALAALPLFLVWVYVSWMITLLGAVLTASLPIVKYERWWHEPAPGSEFVDAMAILKVLHDCARDNDTALVTSAAIRHHTRIGYNEMTSLLEQMLVLGWVGRVKAAVPVRVQWGKRVRDDADGWVLLTNLNKLTLADVYRLFVFSSVPGDDATLAQRVEKAVEERLGQSLAAHFAAG